MSADFPDRASKAPAQAETSPATRSAVLASGGPASPPTPTPGVPAALVGHPRYRVFRREPDRVAMPSPPPDDSIRRFVGHQSPVKTVSFSPTGRYALSGSGYPDRLDCSLRLWDVRTGKEVRRYERHVGAVMSAAFSPPDGRLALSGGADRSLRLWSLPAVVPDSASRRP
jgi:WD40 repeat protein